MLNPKQIDLLLAAGFSKENVAEVYKFLSDGKFEFHNLANIGGGDYRLMYRDENKKMQCLIGKIIYK